jgi:hypothetical protein
MGACGAHADHELLVDQTFVSRPRGGGALFDDRECRGSCLGRDGDARF